MSLVVLHNKNVVTSSIHVAESFGKEHRNVLRDIEGLLKIEHTQELFYESTYTHPQNKQSYRMYYMNRDGFTLLAMGFTGKEALQFKLKYIQAFNEMEKQLTQQPSIPALPTNFKEALQQLLIQVDENEKLCTQNLMLEQQVKELKPKADYVDSIFESKALVNIGQIAKDYGMSAMKMNEILHKLKVQYRQNGQWLLYSKYQDKGYTHSNTIQIQHHDGRTSVKMNTKWTQKGRLFIYELLKKNGILPVVERGVGA